MKRLSLLAIGLLLIMLSIGCIQEDPINPNEPTLPITEQPNEQTPDYTLFENSFGFSSLMITNRENISEGYYTASNAIEFLDALRAEDVKIIEITSDLNLGGIKVEQDIISSGRTLTYYNQVYKKHSRQPLLHPRLIETGVGQVLIHQKEDLMVYSKNGSSILHAGISIDESSNIVFRNLRFAELWEWDEQDLGTYKRNDWDYFTVQESNGVWFDHLTFEQAYDGIIDVKEYSSNLTLSWSKLNFKLNDFIQEQIDHLELNQGDHPFYKSLRDDGITKEQIATLASFQKKGFNLGNTTDGEGFESITMTFHHLEVFNLMDRMPRLRKGDVHLYHLIVDNKELHDLRLVISHPDLSMVNQGIVTTEGGAVLMENSIFRYVTTPIKNHQDANPDVRYSGKYQVLNSELKTINRTYFGSSIDPFTLWIHTGPDETLHFSFNQGEILPYYYHLNDIYYLPETFLNYPTGHQIIPNFNWLSIDTSLHNQGA